MAGAGQWRSALVLWVKASSGRGGQTTNTPSSAPEFCLPAWPEGLAALPSDDNATDGIRARVWQQPFGAFQTHVRSLRVLLNSARLSVPLQPHTLSIKLPWHWWDIVLPL